MALSTPRLQFARHGEFVPVEGGKLNITLPGELIGSYVLQVHGRDVAVVELAVYYNAQGVKKMGALLAKSHTYRPGDIVTVQRAVDDMNVEVWKPVERRHDLDEAQRVAEGLARQPEPQPEPTEDTAPAAPEIGSGPAAEPDITEAEAEFHAALAEVDPDPAPRRVLGPRRSKVSRPQTPA